MSSLIDVAIIGSGPAGWTAALYSSRSMLSTTVFSGDATGGQLMLTNDVENFPGFPNAITGPDLMKNMQEQAEKYGTVTVKKTVTQVTKNGDIFDITISTGEAMQAKTVILATGAQAKWLGLPSEKRLMGKGVSGCAICDGFFFGGQDVVVVGGGNAALEDALFLTKYAKTIYLVHRRDEFRGEKILQEKVKKEEKIKILYFHELQEINGEETVEGVTLLNNQTNKTIDIEASGVFIAIGHSPTTKFVNNLVDTDSDGYAVVKHGSTESSTEGLFLAGDVADKKYRQAITAAGMGCMAALDANDYIKSKF